MCLLTSPLTLTCRMCLSAPKSVCASLHSLITHQATALYSSVQLFKALTRRHCCNGALTLLPPRPRSCSILIVRHTRGIVEEADERQASATCCHNSFATYCSRGTPVCFRGTPRCSNTWIKFELQLWLHVLLDMITSCFLHFMLCVCCCTCTRQSHCVPSSLPVTMCSALHAESSSHAAVPHAPVDNWLVCSVDHVKEKRRKLQEPEQHEAAIGTPAVATDVEGGPLSVSFSFCPNLNCYAAEGLHPSSKRHSVESCRG